MHQEVGVNAVLVKLCDNFLRVAEIVLSWNFASRFLPPKLTYCIETSAGGALRPPITWKDIFQNDDLLNLFFQLHGRVRSDESLCERSMNCLVQLSSLMGDVLNAREGDLVDPYDHYLCLFVHNLLQLFESGPLPGEVTGFCMIWYKLFNFHKVQSFMRFDEPFLCTLLNYMSQYAQHLVPLAMQKALVDDDDSYRGALTNLYEAWLVIVRGFERTERRGSLKDLTLKMLTSFLHTVLSEPTGQRSYVDDDDSYRGALTNLYEAWLVIVRGFERTERRGSLKDLTLKMLTSFLHTVLSEPTGQRSYISQGECMQDMEQDDRERFADTMKMIGHFALYCIERFLPMLYEILKKKIEEFYTFVVNGVEEKALNAWREDMHWILLLFGFVLTDADVDGSCHIPGRVYDYCTSAPKSQVKGAPFIRACIENPRAIPDDSFVDPVLKVTGTILAWCSLEHSMLVEGGVAMVSPELMRTSFWVATRLLAALSVPVDNSDEQNYLMPTLDVNNEFSTFLIQFVFHKTFAVLSKLHGETRVTGTILAWCSLEHSMLVEGGVAMVSPELMRTSFWVATRLLAALSVPVDNSDEQNYLMPTLDVNNEFSTFLIQFVFHKTFAVLSKLHGETSLCKDAADLLLALVDSRASEMAANELLYVSLSSVQLDRLPVRRPLIHTLVLIGAAAENERLQQRMYLSILQPLSEQFLELCADEESRETHIADLLDCFAGVAQAAQQHSAQVLFKFISPILARCVTLFSIRKDSQVLTNAVLDLFSVVTRKLTIYVDSEEDSRFLHQVLLELVEAYRREQLSKYREMDVDQEDKATDLLLFLDILANIMSKDTTLLLVGNEDVSAASGSRTAFTGLEMLLPLMDEHLLKVPTLCVKFYNLLLYFAEMAPEYVGVMPEAMFLSIMECLRHGLQCHFGQEVALISVETLNEMAKYFSQEQQPKPSIIMQLSSLIEEVFTMCLEFSCQVDMFNEATLTLYALICCNRAAFEALAMNLLAKEQNAAGRSQLAEAFSGLLPEGVMNTTRKEAREFRDRFEKFLNRTQGLLVLG
ncbi:Exportin-4 [Toxocara canis]|uniref:Exportin-4 n=1 Tax=Toxocara canis TaxID=6265 RepID=A0A0B2V9Q1_TOXCA|nr:Exportin-4 [Toxocara canis]